MPLADRILIVSERLTSIIKYIKVFLIMEQPRDYEVQAFEEALKEDYDKLNVLGKTIYFIQDHIVKFTFGGFGIGYIIGKFL